MAKKPAMKMGKGKASAKDGANPMKGMAQKMEVKGKKSSGKKPAKKSK